MAKPDARMRDQPFDQPRMSRGEIGQVEAVRLVGEIDIREISRRTYEHVAAV
jgi:hypothetical protein